MAKDSSGIWQIPQARHGTAEVRPRARQLVERAAKARRRLERLADRLGGLCCARSAAEQAEHLVSMAQLLELELERADLQDR